MTKQPGFPQKPALRQVKETASQKEKEARWSGMRSPLQAPARGSVEQTSEFCPRWRGSFSISSRHELGVPAFWMAKWAPEDAPGSGRCWRLELGRYSTIAVTPVILPGVLLGCPSQHLQPLLPLPGRRTGTAARGSGPADCHTLCHAAGVPSHPLPQVGTPP